MTHIHHRVTISIQTITTSISLIDIRAFQY